MDNKAQKKAGAESGKALLKRELQKGLSSGISKRSPSQILTAIRKAREAA